MIRDDMHAMIDALPLPLFEFALECVTDLVIVTTAQADFMTSPIAYVNPAFTRVTGYAEHEVVGRTLHVLEGPETNWRDIARVGHEQSNGRAFGRDSRSFAGSTAIYHKDGSKHISEYRVYSCDDAMGYTTHFVIVQRDDSLRRQYEERLQQQRRQMEEMQTAVATTSANDPLTGLKNNRAFQERLVEEFARARRYGVPLSLFLISIQGFAEYRSSFGHLASDHVLTKFTSILQQASRNTDFLARLDEGEFAVMLPATSSDGAMVAAERLHMGCESAIWAHCPIVAAIGVATLTREYESHTSFKEAAERALCCSQQNGSIRPVHARELPSAG
jgi:diguanylate cyclase (GGDEF)-like protein/PAS domain S-box-containing protein